MEPGYFFLAAALCGVLLLAHLRLRRRRDAWLRSLRIALGKVDPRYPVVLVHGVLGELAIGLGQGDYFRGVVERLEGAGIEVHTPQVSSAAAVAVRARELVNAIEKISAKRVNIIAHSMGGLDARYAITKLGLANRVASLTTIATPHRGTPIADVGTNLFGRKLGLQKLLSAVKLNVDGFYDLTTDNASAFNERIKDVPGVRYGCVLASTSQNDDDLNPLLRPGHKFLSRRTGPNDGLVPVSSQVWGEVIHCISADHWAQVGWSKNFDAPEFYEELVRELGSRGL